MSDVQAVLLDWSGTLVRYPTHVWRLKRAMGTLNRPITPTELDTLIGQIGAAFQLAEFQDALALQDTSSELHRSVHLAVFARSGLDIDLAEALYATYSDLAGHPFYPDAIRVVRELADRGIKVAVVSNIHFDIRPQFAVASILDAVAVFVLSFEHGFQKPDRRMFTTALDTLDVQPNSALMVGDWSATDCAAAEVGIPTLILPNPANDRPKGLDAVLRLVD